MLVDMTIDTYLPKTEAKYHEMTRQRGADSNIQIMSLPYERHLYATRVW